MRQTKPQALAEGQVRWAVTSKSDPAWNMEGVCGSAGDSIKATCENMIHRKKLELGREPPADLVTGEKA